MPPLHEPEHRGIVYFGEALLDFRAGAPANAAMAVAKPRGTCEFVGMLGQDMFGDFQLENLTDGNIAVTALSVWCARSESAGDF